MTPVDAPAAVRPAGPADTEGVIGLIGQLGYHAEEAAYRALFRAMLHKTEHAILVAERDGEVVGFVNLNFRPILHYAQLVATIDELCVDETSRGHGVGAELIQAAIALARQRGADHVQLSTNRRRADALRFYERMGFELTSNFLVYALNRDSEGDDAA
ncbi:MAG: GNAT family N-acetyltransferase [Chloroflexi bacterium]|nr:GNAT family N-acetyltransferase [Chloroflexota bacterium]